MTTLFRITDISKVDLNEVDRMLENPDLGRGARSDLMQIRKRAADYQRERGSSANSYPRQGNKEVKY